MVVVGTAEVQIKALAANLSADVKKAVNAAIRSVDTSIPFSADVASIEKQLKSLSPPSLDVPITSDVGKLSSELSALKPPSIDVPVSADVAKAEADIKSIPTPKVDIPVEADTGKAESNIRSIKAPKIDVELDVSDEEIRKLSDKASVGLGIGLGAAGAVIGLDFASGFEEALSLRNNKQVAARLGLSPEESKKLGEASSRLYAGAWGDSADEVNGALQGIVEKGLLDIDTASQESFQSAGAAALDLAKVLETDVNEVTRTASQLYKNGLAGSAEEAFDLIAAATQAGGDQTGELLETLTEYAPNFKEAGFTGAQAMSIISQGAGSGAFQLDKLGDLIKESGVKLTELNPQKLDLIAGATGQASSEIERLAAAAKEGDNASFLKLVDSIKGIENETDRATAAVELFGTPFEDLSKSAFFNIDFGAELDGVAGSAVELGDTLNDSLLVKIESIKRTGFIALANIGNFVLVPALDLIGAAVRPLITVFNIFGESFRSVFSGAEVDEQQGVLGIVQRLATTVGELFQDILFTVNLFTTAFSRAWNGDTEVTESGFFGVVQYIAATVAPVLKDALGTVTEFGNGIIDIFDSLGSISLGIDFDSLLPSAPADLSSISGPLEDLSTLLADPFPEIPEVKFPFEFSDIREGASIVSEVTGEVNTFTSDMARILPETLQVTGAFFAGFVRQLATIDFTAFFNLILKVKDAFVQLAPPALEIINILIKTAGPAFNSIVGYVIELANVLARVTAVVIDEFLPVLRDLLEEMQGPLERIFGTISDLIVDVLVPALQDLLANFEKDLIPMLQKDLQPLLESVKDAFILLAERIASIVEVLAPVIKVIVQVLTPILKNLASLLIDVLGNAFQIVTGLINLLIGIFTGDFTKAINGLKDIFGGLLGIIIAPFNSAISRIGDFITKFKSKGKEIGKSLIDGITSGLSAVGGVGTKVVDAIKSGVNRNVIDKINSGINKINIPGVTLPNLPRLAQGGIFTKELQAIIAEAGPEAVIPLSQAKEGRALDLLELSGLGELYLSSLLNNNSPSSPVPSSSSAPSLPSVGGGGGGVTNNVVTFNITQREGESGEDLARQISDELRRVTMSGSIR